MSKRNIYILSLFFVLIVGISLNCAKSENDSRFRDYEQINPSRDFTLTDQNGKTFHLKDHRGQIVLLFFGYLSCPDVCPTTLSKLTKVYKSLSSDRSRVLTAFVSLDPGRDTPQKIKEYLSYFDVESVGLVGTEREINAVVDAYKASYEKVDTKSALGYLIDHTDYIYLIDAQGKVRYLFRSDDKAEDILKVIKKVLKS